MNLEHYKDLAIEATKRAEKVINHYYKNLKTIETKKGAGLVTKADKEAENVIIEFLSKETNFSFLAEESKTKIKKESKWIIDPIDGTTNFVHGFPHFNVSIGLEIDDIVVVGVIYNPATKDLYSTVKGKGAFKNGKKISVTKNANLKDSLLATGFAYTEGAELDKALKLFKTLKLKTHGLRRPGSAALDLCYVAEGIFDGFYERTLNAWDVAAGSLLVSEAGGIISNYENENFNLYGKSIIASNGKIHKELQKEIKTSFAL